MILPSGREVALANAAKGAVSMGGKGLPGTMTGLVTGLAGLGLAAAGAYDVGFLTTFLIGLGRPESPRRCALPMTALWVTPPSFSAISEALLPDCHIFFSVLMRSSVQLKGIYSIPGVVF